MTRGLPRTTTTDGDRKEGAVGGRLGRMLAVFEGTVGFVSRIEEMLGSEVLVESGSFSRVEVVDGICIVQPYAPNR